jgi:hypothetical protein
MCGHCHPQQPLHQARHGQHGEGFAYSGASVTWDKIDLPLDRVRVRAAGDRAPDELARFVRGDDLIQASPPKPAAPVGSPEARARCDRADLADPCASPALPAPLTHPRHVADNRPDRVRWRVNDGLRCAHPPHRVSPLSISRVHPPLRAADPALTAGGSPRRLTRPTVGRQRSGNVTVASDTASAGWHPSGAWRPPSDASLARCHPEGLIPCPSPARATAPPGSPSAGTGCDSERSRTGPGARGVRGL